MAVETSSNGGHRQLEISSGSKLPGKLKEERERASPFPAHTVPGNPVHGWQSVMNFSSP